MFLVFDVPLCLKMRATRSGCPVKNSARWNASYTPQPSHSLLSPHKVPFPTTAAMFLTKRYTRYFPFADSFSNNLELVFVGAGTGWFIRGSDTFQTSMSYVSCPSCRTSDHFWTVGIRAVACQFCGVQCRICGVSQSALHEPPMSQ